MRKGGRLPQRDVLEGVVRRRRPVLVPPVAAAQAPVAEARRRGSARCRTSSRRSGTCRSASSRRPRAGSPRARSGRAAPGTARPPRPSSRRSRRQIRSVADVVRAFAASTVISCARRRLRLQPVRDVRRARRRDGRQERLQSSIGGQSSLRAMRVAALAAALGVATAAGTGLPGRDRARCAGPSSAHSYRAGCPVGPPDLRTVRLSYWGFDGRPHEGTLVVHRRVASDVVAVFRRLYEARFPIRRMQPVSAYRGSDDASMAADNTSAFNCRRAVGSATGSLVEPRLRARDRRQPGGEPIRPRLARAAARGKALPRP